MPANGQVGGIADLAPGGGGRLLAAVYPIARGGHYFAAARIRPNGRPDRSFGHDGFTPRLRSGRGEVKGGGHLQAEAVAGQKDGQVLLAGYLDAEGAFAPALARFTAKGRFDPSFGNGGKVFPRPVRGGRRIDADGGGERLHDVAIKPNGKIDRGFGRNGRVTVGGPSEIVVLGRGGYMRAPFAVDRHGRIVLCGLLYPHRGIEEPVAFLRLLPDGRRDRSFGRSRYMERAPIDAQEPYPRKRGVQGFTFEPQAIAIDGRGRILVTAGETAPYVRGQTEPGHEVFASRRFLPSGRRDRSFGEGGVWHTDPPGSQSLGRAALTQPDGRVVAGGWVQIERFGGNGPGNTATMLTRYR